MPRASTVNRRARRAKTDRLDVGTRLGLLLRWLGGDRNVWSVGHVPSPEAEAQRQLTREIATVREDRQRVRHRIQAWLATHGLRLDLDATVLAHLATAQTGDGRALPTAFPLASQHEWAHLEAIDARRTALAAARDARDRDGHRSGGGDRTAALHHARGRRNQCGGVQRGTVRHADVSARSAHRSGDGGGPRSLSE